MDGRGRLAQPMTWTRTWLAPWRAWPAAQARAAPHAHAARPRSRPARPATARSAFGRALQRSLIWIFNLRVPSGAGMTASGVFFLATLAYGIVIGDHIPA